MNIMRKKCYHKVTVYCCTGSTDKFREYTVLLSAWYTFGKFIHGPCAAVGGHLVIARFSQYIQQEHSITPLALCSWKFLASWPNMGMPRPPMFPDCLSLHYNTTRVFCTIILPTQINAPINTIIIIFCNASKQNIKLYLITINICCST